MGRRKDSGQPVFLSDSGRILQSMIETVRIGSEPIRPPAEVECQPHHIEHEVQRQLLSRPELQFSSLVIRRMPNGVCLEGVLEVENEAPDICELVRRVCGVNEVLNHLVVRRAVSEQCSALE